MALIDIRNGRLDKYGQFMILCQMQNGAPAKLPCIYLNLFPSKSWFGGE